MAALNPPVCDFDWPAPDFCLPATDGRLLSRDALRGEHGLLVMFICNHCPYVQAIIGHLIRDCQALQALGIGCAAIMSNDTEAYPADAFPNMQRWASELNFPFPYLLDADQRVARAYGAVCTPDFFGFNAQLGLQYRGRLDASGRTPGPADAPRELLEAMRQIAASGRGPAQQTASIGCSIKWRI